MKIAISSRNNDLESPIDNRFGRAQGFIIFDTDTREHSYIDNEQNLNSAQGAGIQTAQNVAKAGVQAVITGNVGPKAFTALEKGNIGIYYAGQETVSQSIENFEKGTIPQAGGASKPGHW